MAKIDVSKLAGYDSYPDEVKKAIEGYEIPDADYTGYVKKDVFDKKASEASELSKQLKAKMTEQELADAESEKAFADMKAELETLKREKTVSGYKAKYLGLGYDEKLADETAIAMADGKTDIVFANQQKFLENQKKAIEAEALNKQPGVTAGDPPNSQNVEDQAVAAFRRAAMGQ